MSSLHKPLPHHPQFFTNPEAPQSRSFLFFFYSDCIISTSLSSRWLIHSSVLSNLLCVFHFIIGYFSSDLSYIFQRFIKILTFGVPVVAQWLTNPTRNHEVPGLIPGLAQWVNDPALP